MPKTPNELAFDQMWADRNKALVIHELDQIFGPGNALSLQVKQTGEIPISMLVRAIVRQQFFVNHRLAVIEEKLGIKFDPKEVTK
jgi:hypothetical protein